MGQKGLICLEGGGSKNLSQLNFQLHRSLGIKVQFFDPLRCSAGGRGGGGGGVFSTLFSVKLDLYILES